MYHRAAHDESISSARWWPPIVRNGRNIQPNKRNDTRAGPSLQGCATSVRGFRQRITANPQHQPIFALMSESLLLRLPLIQPRAHWALCYLRVVPPKAQCAFDGLGHLFLFWVHHYYSAKIIYFLTFSYWVAICTFLWAIIRTLYLGPTLVLLVSNMKGVSKMTGRLYCARPINKHRNV